MNDEILSEEEVARRRSMHVCARTRPTGCEHCEALDCITTLRADRDRWRVTAESDAADLAMAYALGELAAADRDRLEARLAEVRRERDDLEVSLATVAAGFEQARARVGVLERALQDIQMWADGRTPLMVYVADRARGALDVAPFVCENCGKPMRDHGSLADCWPAAAPEEDAPDTSEWAVENLTIPAPASDQPPVPEQTTGEPGGES